MDRIKQIYSRLDSASSGPWKGSISETFEVQDGNGKTIAKLGNIKNTEFFVHSREDMEYLLSKISQLYKELGNQQARIEELEKEKFKMKSWNEPPEVGKEVLVYLSNPSFMSPYDLGNLEEDGTFYSRIRDLKIATHWIMGWAELPEI